MGIQAILFDKKYFTVRQANAFLKGNNFIKIKPFHITNKYLRARLIERSHSRAHAREPNYKKHNYKKGNLTFGVDCIFEF